MLVLAMSRPHKLTVQWHGPGVIENQLSETNYIVKLAEKGERSQIYHINMLKPYYQRPEAINLLSDLDSEAPSLEREIVFPNLGTDPNIYDFENITRDSGLGERLKPEQIKQIENVLVKHMPVFSNEPGVTDLVVQTDASDSGMGVVLSQRNDAGEEHPVLYLSKKFSSAEKNYSTTEKECASIVFAVKKLHYYLDGQNFTVITDHNPLVWLQRNAGTNPRLTRWSLALQPYNFKIEHRAGKRHANADGLSRADIE